MKRVKSNQKPSKSKQQIKVEEMRRAIVMAEVLGLPRSKRRYTKRRDSAR